MPTEGLVKSNLLGVYIDIDGTEELVACSTSDNLSSQMEVIDATCKDNDGARNVLPGGNTWDITTEVLVKWGTVDNTERLWTAHQEKKVVTVRYSSDVQGDWELTGDAYITQFDFTAGLNEVATASITLSGTGELTKQDIT